MKNLRLIIYIVVILAIVCSPVLAISMSDLIAQRQGQSAPTIPTVVRPTIPTPVLPSSYFMDVVYEDEVVLVNERYNIYADRHGGNLHFNPVIRPRTTSRSDNWTYGECPPMHYESGMVR